MSKAAVEYAWRQIARLSGIGNSSKTGTGFDSFGISVYYGDPEELKEEAPSIIVRPSQLSDWTKILSLPKSTIDFIPSKEILPVNAQHLLEEDIPVLLWGKSAKEDGKPFVELTDNGLLIFNADILGTVFFLLSRWEEMILPDRDRYGRFPASASAMFRQGILDRPILDEYGLLIRAWLELAFPECRPTQRSFTFQISHDIDTLRQFQNARKFFGSLFETLYRRRSLSQFLDTLRITLEQILSKIGIGQGVGIHQLINLSREYNIETTFYLMSGNKGSLDYGYDYDIREVANLVAYLGIEAHEVGLHANPDSNKDNFLLRKDKSYLERILRHRIYTCRVHYLSFEIPSLWKNLEDAGLTRSSNLAYAEHEGFRCGTSHPFHPFDIQNDREMDIEETPLIIMDSTLIDYRKFEPANGKKRILELAAKCKRTGGTFTLLWHNTSLRGPRMDWGVVYQEVLEELKTISQSELT